jgi:hypothetical protein
MDLAAQIDLVAEWLDATDAATAQVRVDEAVARAHSPDKLRAPLAATAFEARRAALHEACHACAAQIAGIGVVRVYVRNGSGACEYGRGRDGDESQPLGLLAAIDCDLAGIHGELFSDCADDARQFQLAHSPDVLAASLRLAQLRKCGPEWAQFPTRTAASIGACVIREHWATVSRLAACLAAVGELSGVEVAAMCGRPS